MNKRISHVFHVSAGVRACKEDYGAGEGEGAGVGEGAGEGESAGAGADGNT